MKLTNNSNSWEYLSLVQHEFSFQLVTSFSTSVRVGGG